MNDKSLDHLCYRSYNPRCHEENAVAGLHNTHFFSSIFYFVYRRPLLSEMNKSYIGAQMPLLCCYLCHIINIQSR
jgi:hypothetical protein